MFRIYFNMKEAVMNTKKVAYRFWELVKTHFPELRMKEPTDLDRMDIGFIY